MTQASACPVHVVSRHSATANGGGLCASTASLIGGCQAVSQPAAPIGAAAKSSPGESTPCGRSDVLAGLSQPAVGRRLYGL